MRNGLIKKSLVLAGGLLLCAGTAAHADSLGYRSLQTQVGFYEDSTNTFDPIYKVLMDSNDGLTWNVRVIADPSNDPAFYALHNIHQVRLDFYDQLQPSNDPSGPHPGHVLMNSGFSTNVADTVAITAGASAQNWTPLDPVANNGDVLFYSPDPHLPANGIQADESNYFQAQFTLSAADVETAAHTTDQGRAGGNGIDYIRIGLQDGDQLWSGKELDFNSPNLGIDPTPEAGQLAMLLPGLLPIGMVLRRRRKA